MAIFLGVFIGIHIEGLCKINKLIKKRIYPK